MQDEIDQTLKEVGSGAVPPEAGITRAFSPTKLNPASTIRNPNDSKTTPVPGTALATPSAATAPDKAERSNGPNGKPITR